MNVVDAPGRPALTAASMASCSRETQALHELVADVRGLLPPGDPGGAVLTINLVVVLVSFLFLKHSSDLLVVS